MMENIKVSDVLDEYWEIYNSILKIYNINVEKHIQKVWTRVLQFSSTDSLEHFKASEVKTAYDNNILAYRVTSKLSDYIVYTIDNRYIEDGQAPNIFICITDVEDNPLIFVADDRVKIVVNFNTYGQNYYWLDFERELYFAYYQRITDLNFYNTLNLFDNHNRFEWFIKSFEDYNNKNNEINRVFMLVEKLYLHRENANVIS